MLQSILIENTTILVKRRIGDNPIKEEILLLFFFVSKIIINTAKYSEKLIFYFQISIVVIKFETKSLFAVSEENVCQLSRRYTYFYVVPNIF